MGTSPFFFRSNKMLNRGLDKQELLRIVEAVANEKSIDKYLEAYAADRSTFVGSFPENAPPPWGDAPP